MKVSIIIPVYNAEKYIENCLESIIKQNYSDYEIILIDDGSKDESGHICDELAERHPGRVRVFHITNGGPSRARNYGIEKASGEFIQFVDADDSISSDCLEQFSKEVSRFQADFIIGNAVMVDSDGKQLEVLDIGCTGSYKAGELIEHMTLETKALYVYYIWNKWYKTEIIKKFNLKFDCEINLGEDFLFNCSYLRFCKSVSLMRKVIYNYYKRDNQSLTQIFHRDELERRRRMDNSLINLYHHFNILDRKKEFVDSSIGAITLVSMEAVVGKNCRISLREKTHYINSFIRSEYYEYLMAFRKHKNMCSPTAALELFLIKLRMPKALLAVITARKYISRLL